MPAACPTDQGEPTPPRPLALGQGPLLGGCTEKQTAASPPSMRGNSLPQGAAFPWMQAWFCRGACHSLTVQPESKEKRGKKGGKKGEQTAWGRDCSSCCQVTGLSIPHVQGTGTGHPNQTSSLVSAWGTLGPSRGRAAKRVPGEQNGAAQPPRRARRCLALPRYEEQPGVGGG